MPLVETKVLRSEWEVTPVLDRLRTSKPILLRIRDIAIGASADATPFHPANASGTLAYQQGVYALRAQHVGKDGWSQDRPSGVEAIINHTIKVRIAFQNVDVACSLLNLPKSRSEKGAGSERVCSDSGLFTELPHYIIRSAYESDGWVTYYLMVAPNGAAELSRVVIENGRFSSFVERIFLSDGSDVSTDLVAIESPDLIDKFDPQITRK